MSAKTSNPRALRALPAPDRAQVDTYRAALRRSVAGTSRGARFLAGYLATSLDRVAHNCAQLARLARDRRWLDVGGFGLEALMLQQQGVPCTAHVISFEGDLLGLDREGRIVNAAAEMVHSIRVDPLDVPMPLLFEG